jgi:glycosyltransferase involved in cell wall biosynthesis
VRLLHLFANWKWTGPAEPAVNLAATLAQRGHDVRFACGAGPSLLPNDVADEAARRGLEPILRLHLGKHRHPIYDPLDRRALRKLLREIRPDVVHCHMPNDHRIAAEPCAELSIPIVRSLYEGDPPPAANDTRKLVRGCRTLLVISDRIRSGVIERFGLAPERVVTVEPAVDLRRFNPRARNLPDLRPTYGLQAGDFVVGIVARMQRHRRFELFFEALVRAAREIPTLKVLLVGRGTWMEEVAVKPAARKELAGRAVFTGYRRGAEYVATLRCMDVKIYLTPGSDGSCRAAREAMAMGVPLIAARRGHLVDLVDDGTSGILVGDDPEEISRALLKMHHDPAVLKSMSEASHARAHKRYGLPTQARRVEAVYEEIAARKA